MGGLRGLRREQICRNRYGQGNAETAHPRAALPCAQTWVDPDPVQIDAAIACGAPVIELHTGAYADTEGAEQQAELERIRLASEYAFSKGLIVNAGHGLHYHNVEPVAEIPQLHELNIGHGIIARAIFVGLDQAIREMSELMHRASGRVEAERLRIRA